MMYWLSDFMLLPFLLDELLGVLLGLRKHSKTLIECRGDVSFKDREVKLVD